MEIEKCLHGKSDRTAKEYLWGDKLVQTHWLREQLQLLKHHSCAAIRTELPRLGDHPQCSSPRHHQPSVHFYATMLLTDLIFPFIVVCVSYKTDEFADWLIHRTGRAVEFKCMCLNGNAHAYIYVDIKVSIANGL